MNADDVRCFWQFSERLREFEPQAVGSSDSFFECYFEDALIGFIALRRLENVGSTDAFQPVARRQGELQHEHAGALDGVINRRGKSHLVLAQTDVVAADYFDLR